MARASQFLKFTDKNGQQVDGESYDDQHLREIEITGWNWDVEDPAVPKSDAKKDGDAGAKDKGKSEGEGDRKPKPSKFSFSKSTDRSTTRLLSAMDTGEIFAKAVITLEEKFEEAPMAFHMEITLTDVFVVDLKWNASAEGAGTKFSEDWELNYSDIRFDYKVKSGVITQRFVRPPDAIAGTSKKSPLTAAETNAKGDDRIKELVSEALKKALKK